jgi:hypothetical protein
MAGRKVKIFTDWRKVVQTLEDSYENLNGVPRPEWMMKDIIQNSWDARKDKSNAENWVFTISLIESKGSSVIVFEDEGTTGLTGKLTADEATKKLENGEELPPTERRARFYANAVTWSDGQDAAGGRGQGKGVLVIANSYESVVFESKSADGYFSGALVRDASGANMEDDETTPEEFAARHCPSLRPKKTSGVRIVLGNPDPDLVYAIETGEIDGHILASWWPLIATEGRIRIQVNGVSRELEATGAYENLVNSYRTNSPLEGHLVIKKPSKDDAIIGHSLAKSAVSVLELNQDDSDEDELDHRALGVHLIRQGMIVERYRLQESLLQLTYEIKNEHREAVCQGFYGYLEISGTEGNRELKRYENPLHYGFTGGRGGRVWKSVASYLEDPTRHALGEWGFLMDDDEAEIERDKAVQSAVQGEINKLARKLGINPSKATVPGTSDGRNKPGGSPHLPIQIAIDNPKRGESLPKGQPIDGLLARVRNRQQCTVTVDVEYQLEVPGEEAKQLAQVEATIAASEEREFAIPTIPAAAVSEAGRYRLIATVRLKSAGNLEVLDKALLSASGQVKMGWYRSDAVNLYIATPPPQKGLIDWVFESGSWYTPMEYVHDHKSPKVRVYEGSSVMKNAKVNGDEAIASLYREIGLRALAGYVVTDEKALQALLTKTELDDAESKGILAESIYFQLQSRM